MNLFIVICICHQQTYSIIHAVYSPFNQYKSFACFHYHSNVWEINRISVAAVIFLAKYNISGHRESSPWCCNSIIREYIWQTSFGWGSYKKLLTHLHKLTNGLVREYLLICVGSLSNFFFFLILKGLSVIIAGLESFRGQWGRLNSVLWHRECWFNKFLVR